MINIKHHGATSGVTGSCHELRVDDSGILIDCGLFQGEEERNGAGADSLAIDFPIDHIRALVVTHVHIDHVGRIPYLLAAGFDGPIICSEPSAVMLPEILEDALKIGFTRDRALIERVLGLIRSRLVPVPYGEWHSVFNDSDVGNGLASLSVRLQRAGHILGSAYVECEAQSGEVVERIVFSGDLGAPHAPLLPEPKSPERCDRLVIESTYGDKDHENRETRRLRLKAILEHALADGGTVLIPAFSIGRTQELLYEIEGIIHEFGQFPAAAVGPLGTVGPVGATSVAKSTPANSPDSAVPGQIATKVAPTNAKPNVAPTTAKLHVAPIKTADLPVGATSVAKDIPANSASEAESTTASLDWSKLEIVVDSPLAANFTRIYDQLKHFWDAEALERVQHGRHPLSFDQLTVIDDHKDHLNAVEYLARSHRPCVVLAGSGMCAGGRVVNYLKAMLDEPRNDVLFVGYQAAGTPGRNILQYGPLGGWVMLDNGRYDIRARIHQVGGYSAHAGQSDLVRFVTGMAKAPGEIRIVHGDATAKHALKKCFDETVSSRVEIPR